MRLPSQLVARHAESDRGAFVLKKGFDRCLDLYPLSSWEEKSRSYEELNERDPDQRRLRRKFFKSVTDVTLDGSSRILLPKRLAESVAIERDVIILGVGTHYEIWDPAEFEREDEEADDDSALAARVADKTDA